MLCTFENTSISLIPVLPSKALNRLHGADITKFILRKQNLSYAEYSLVSKSPRNDYTIQVLRYVAATIHLGNRVENYFGYVAKLYCTLCLTCLSLLP